MALYSLGPLVGMLFQAPFFAPVFLRRSEWLGPVVGPVAGGFIAQTIGVKWVFIVIASTWSHYLWWMRLLTSNLVACGLVSLVGIPLLEETYAPVIRLRRAAKSGDPEKQAAAHPHLLQEHGSKLHVLWINLYRPVHLLFNSLVCFVLSLYMALYVTFFVNHVDITDLSIQLVWNLLPHVRDVWMYVLILGHSCAFHLT